MSAIRCSECGLINPGKAVMCDCGNLLNGAVTPEILAKAREANRDMVIERQKHELAHAHPQARFGLKVLSRFMRSFFS